VTTPGSTPAFPVPDTVSYSENCGLSKREYLAGLAMQGILASWPANGRALDPLATAQTAVKFADEMLNALESS
jgi:hypothetical protein